MSTGARLRRAPEKFNFRFPIQTDIYVYLRGVDFKFEVVKVPSKSRCATSERPNQLPCCTKWHILFSREDRNTHCPPIKCMLALAHMPLLSRGDVHGYSAHSAAARFARFIAASVPRHAAHFNHPPSYKLFLCRIQAFLR